jgi:hypothetical protein
MSANDSGNLKSEVKALAFVAWSLNAALDEDSGDLSLERLEQFIGSGGFLDAVKVMDSMDAVAMLTPSLRAAVNSRVLELWEVRRLKYAGAKASAGHVAMGFLLAVLSERLGSNRE